MFPTFDSTKNYVDSFDIKVLTPETAVSRCHILAYHYLKGAEKGESWVLVGHYEHSLVLTEDGKWLINKMKMIVEQNLGNTALYCEGLAKKKAEQQ